LLAKNQELQKAKEEGDENRVIGLQAQVESLQSQLGSIDEFGCNVYITRVACEGKEAISYKKCGGKQSCKKRKKADSLESASFIF